MRSMSPDGSPMEFAYGKLWVCLRQTHSLITAKSWSKRFRLRVCDEMIGRVRKSESVHYQAFPIFVFRKSAAWNRCRGPFSSSHFSTKLSIWKRKSPGKAVSGSLFLHKTGGLCRFLSVSACTNRVICARERAKRSVLHDTFLCHFSLHSPACRLTSWRSRHFPLLWSTI